MERDPPEVPARARSSALSVGRVVVLFGVVLLAAGVFFWLRGQGREPAVDDGPLDARLTSAARRLATSHADLFAEFQPYSLAELEAVTRDESAGEGTGGLQVLQPAGTVLEAERMIRWVVADSSSPDTASPDTASLDTASPDTASPHTMSPRRVVRCDLALLGEDGSTVWKALGVASPSQLPAGTAWPGVTYAIVVSLPSTDPAGRVSARRAFRVYGKGDALRHRRQVSVVHQDVDPTLVDLLLAHLAMREDLWQVAEGRADAFRARAPGEPLATATLEAVRRHLGWPAPDPATPRRGPRGPR